MIFSFILVNLTTSLKWKQNDEVEQQNINLISEIHLIFTDFGILFEFMFLKIITYLRDLFETEDSITGLSPITKFTSTSSLVFKVPIKAFLGTT